MSKPKLKRVVVFGGGGFIGKAIVNKLQQENIDVMYPTSSEINLINNESIEQICALLRPSDSVVMLSALTPDKGRGIAELLKNISMMQNLICAIKKIGCVHLVYFSSDAVYGKPVGIVNELSLTAPNDLYGLMHLTREVMLENIGAPYLILRPTLVYGQSDSHNAYGINRFIRSAQSEEKIYLYGNGEELRDYISVDDIAKITILGLKMRTKGIYNLASGSSYSFLEIANMIKKSSNALLVTVSLDRKNPIWHKHFDICKLLKLVPSMQFKSIQSWTDSQFKN
jgi:UDP-glucose 4-epimerase